jgi:hypothetical protein
MWMNLTDVGVFSANTTLSTDSRVRADSWIGSPPAGGLGAYGPGDIATNFGAASFAAQYSPGNNIFLGTLVVTLGYLSAPADIQYVYARVGNGLIGQTDFLPADVSYAGGAPGNGQTSDGLASVMIFDVPEPATLGVLGLFAITRIRRRR